MLMRSLIALVVLSTLAGSLLAQAETEKRLVDMEKKLANVEEQARRAERGAEQAERESSRAEIKFSNAAPYGTVAFLFGVFCALWAQNTGRNAWLWFFLGLFFSPITGIVLLSKNSTDRRLATGV